MPKKVLSYEDKKYVQKEHLYDSLSQAFQDLKADPQYQGSSWNIPVEHLKGTTMKFLGEDKISLTYHKLETGDLRAIDSTKEDGFTFLKEVEKQLKNRFKKLTKKAINLKKEKQDTDIEKYSVLQADTSWIVGSSRYGYGRSEVGRYIIRNTIVYSISSDLE